MPEGARQTPFGAHARCCVAGEPARPPASVRARGQPGGAGLSAAAGADGGDGGRFLLLRSAGTVGALTLLSRILGYLRDMAVAALLGTGPVHDAFQAAFQLPNALRRLASEGNLSAAFVPVFARVAREQADGEAWRFADRFHTAVLLLVGAATLLGIVAAPWLIGVLYGAFARSPGKLELTVRLARLVFGYALFISLSAVLMAVLNACRRFAAAAFTPVLLNLSIIAFALAAWARGATDRAVLFIVTGVVVGGLLQWSFLVPFARRAGMRFRFRPEFGDPHLRQVGRLIGPRLLGVGVVQVNIMVGQVLAAGLGDGPVAALYLGARLTELTLGVFAVSVATVVLPTLSYEGARGDTRAMRKTLSFALRQVTAVTLPAAVGLLLLRGPIVAVLFQRGAFDARSTELTAAALGGYAAGLVAVAAVRIAAPAFYALHDTRTPTLVAVAAMFVNLAGCLWLRDLVGVGGIALANSFAAWVSAACLLGLLRRRLGRLEGRLLAASIARIGVAAAAMGWVVRAAAGRSIAPAATGLAGAPALLAVIGLGMLTYAAALAALGAPEVGELTQVFRRRTPDTLEGQATRQPSRDDEEGGP